MKRKAFWISLLLAILLLGSIVPVSAQAPGKVYVNPNRTAGNEDGTKANPYNTEKEAKAYARSLRSGAYLYRVDNAGNVTYLEYVEPVYPGSTGVPLPRLLFYVLLALLALALIVVGWQLRRRAHQL